MHNIEGTLYSREFLIENFPFSCRWIATLGIILAVSRGFIQESGVAYEPEEALTEVVMHTHHLPRHWRGRAHTREVQEQFQQLFQFKVGAAPPFFSEGLLGAYVM